MSALRARVGLGAVIALWLLAGCGSGPSGDPELTIYLSAPLSGPRAAEGRDVADGARLALADAGGEAGGTSVSLKVLDDAGGGGWDAARAGANARSATQDSTTIAYLGELDSGASRTSIPITNEAGILQVSPASGAEDLTREAIGSSRVPTDVQPSGARTFGRVIPSDRVQGGAAGGWMAARRIASVAVVGDEEDPFGAALVSGLNAASNAPALVGAKANPEAAFLVADRIEGSAPRIRGGTGVSPFGSDALLDEPQRLGDARLTSAALDPSQLPPGAASFLDDFAAEYGRPPGRLGAYGYEAMAAVLDSIERAEDPLDRKAVVDAFFAIAERESILGTYSIDEVGDTTLGELGAYEVRDGRLIAEPEPLPAR